MLWIGSVAPWLEGRLGQLLTGVQSNCGLAISAVSLTTSLGSVHPLRGKASIQSVMAISRVLHRSTPQDAANNMSDMSSLPWCGHHMQLLPNYMVLCSVMATACAGRMTAKHL